MWPCFEAAENKLLYGKNSLKKCKKLAKENGALDSARIP